MAVSVGASGAGVEVADPTTGVTWEGIKVLGLGALAEGATSIDDPLDTTPMVGNLTPAELAATRGGLRSSSSTGASPYDLKSPSVR